MAFRKIGRIIGQTFVEFFEDKVLKLSASLAYYTVFSLPAMLIIIIAVSGTIYGQDAEASLYHQISNLIGHDAAIQIQNTIRAAALSADSRIAAIIGGIVLLVTATTIFTEIQDSINYIWKLKPKPKKGQGFLKLLFNRLISFSLIVTLGFILLVSLIINSMMDALSARLVERFPDATVFILYTFNFLLTFLVTSLLFAIIFKVLPDARIKWKQIRVGAFVTAGLFMLGKFLISFYLGRSNFTSAYGAAGSIIIILVWVYFSAVILYFGAVFTKVWVVHKGSRIYPNSYAVWVQQIEVESAKSVQAQPEKKTVIQTEETPPPPTTN